MMDDVVSYESNSAKKQRLKKENLWILQWICRIGLVFAILIFADFLLPTREFDSQIVQNDFRLGSRHRRTGGIRIQIESGQHFSVYRDQLGVFREINQTGVIRVQVSRLFGMVLRVVDEAHTKSVSVSIASSFLIVVPALLLLTSLVGVLARNRVEVVFNFGALALIMIAGNFFLIYFIM